MFFFIPFRSSDAGARLGHVAVLVGRVGRPFQVLLVDERFDALLDEADRWSEARLGLAQHLLDEHVVAQHLPRLHDAHHRGLHNPIANKNELPVTTKLPDR